MAADSWGLYYSEKEKILMGEAVHLYFSYSFLSLHNFILAPRIYSCMRIGTMIRLWYHGTILCSVMFDFEDSLVVCWGWRRRWYRGFVLRHESRFWLVGLCVGCEE